MKGTEPGDRITFFLLGTAVGAVAALPSPRRMRRARRTLRRKGEDLSEYVVEAGKELAEQCEDLYKRSGEVVGEAAHELSEKYRELHQRSKELVDEAAGLIHRVGRRSAG